jgi:hypothetical protein
MQILCNKEELKTTEDLLRVKRALKRSEILHIRVNVFDDDRGFDMQRVSANRFSVNRFSLYKPLPGAQMDPLMQLGDLKLDESMLPP